MFTVINNRQEFLEFINDKKEEFGCNEDWEGFFGFELMWDEDTGEVLETIFDYKGEISTEPTDYPCVTYHTFDTLKDFRHGNMDIQLFDWITFKEINLK